MHKQQINTTVLKCNLTKMLSTRWNSFYQSDVSDYIVRGKSHEG